MRIVQITDQHIGRPGETPNDVDVRLHFLQLCQKIEAIHPAFIVITGDLCAMAGEMDTYQWMKQRLEQLDIPYAVISGNHDDPELLARAFDLEDHLHDGELYYRRRLGEEWALFLDTTPGTLSQKQLDWIAQQLKQPGGDRQLIFMHHPPVLAGIPHMDNNYPLLEPARHALQVLFTECPSEVYVFCGHYHNGMTIRRDFGTVFITPSSYLQIDPHQEAFAIEHTIPGLRYIELQPREIRSAVHYLPE